MHTTQRYRNDLAAGHIDPDPAQERILGLFDQLLDSLAAQAALARRSRGPLANLIGKVFGRTDNEEAIKGIYLWGGVGRGKTYLMDLFYDCLPGERKQRTHFYRFMQGVHGRLTELQGAANPLAIIAADIARDTDVLCFDEFFVSDIGDAMLMAGLLENLFGEHVILIATSNVPPHRLYENGLQRERFLPAIDLIEQNTQVEHMADGIDYRLRKLTGSDLYLFPMSDEAEQQLARQFSALAPDQELIEEGRAVEILGREIATRFCADDVVWFEFGQLCDGPRSAFDYVEISRLFHALILSDVPQMNDSSNEQARRFISLIDELYDRQVKLIVAAQVPLAELYVGKQLDFEFQRTYSRLTEMQSHDYLASGHLA